MRGETTTTPPCDNRGDADDGDDTDATANDVELVESRGVVDDEPPDDA